MSGLGRNASRGSRVRSRFYLGGNGMYTQCDDVGSNSMAHGASPPTVLRYIYASIARRAKSGPQPPSSKGIGSSHSTQDSQLVPHIATS